MPFSPTPPAEPPSPRSARKTRSAYKAEVKPAMPFSPTPPAESPAPRSARKTRSAYRAAEVIPAMPFSPTPPAESPSPRSARITRSAYKGMRSPRARSKAPSRADSRTEETPVSSPALPVTSELIRPVSDTSDQTPEDNPKEDEEGSNEMMRPLSASSDLTLGDESKEVEKELMLDGDVVEAEAECKSGLTRPEAPLLETPVAFDQATPALSTPQESTPRRPKSVAKDGNVVDADSECKSGPTRPESPLLETPGAIDLATPAFSTPEQSTQRRPNSICKDGNVVQTEADCKSGPTRPESPLLETPVAYDPATPAQESTPRRPNSVCKDGDVIEAEAECKSGLTRPETPLLETPVVFDPATPAPSTQESTPRRIQSVANGDVKPETPVAEDKKSPSPRMTRPASKGTRSPRARSKAPTRAGSRTEEKHISSPALPATSVLIRPVSVTSDQTPEDNPKEVEEGGGEMMRPLTAASDLTLGDESKEVEKELMLDGNVIEAEAERKSCPTRPESPLLETPVAYDPDTPALSTPQESTPRRTRSLSRGVDSEAGKNSRARSRVQSKDEGETKYRRFVNYLQEKYNLDVTGTSYPLSGNESNANRHAIDAFELLRRKDQEVVNSLKNASKNYSDVQKLQKDIEEAHIMLASMERDVEHLNSQKVKSQDILERVKTDHKTLQDEKVYLQQQLNIAKKECIGKNKRKIKEVQQLVDEFQKLDQKEKMLRKHVAMIESELFLIISKLETPDQANEKKQKPGHTEATEPKIWQPTGKPFTSQDELPQVPGLDLAQLNNQIILPPIKNSGPKAPRKGVNTTSVAEKNFTSFNTGYKNTLKMSNSTPSIQNYELILADAKATHEKARHKGHNANKVYGNHQPERLLNRERQSGPRQPVRNPNRQQRPEPQQRTQNRPRQPPLVLSNRKPEEQQTKSRFPDIVKGSQLMDKSKIVPKQVESAGNKRQKKSQPNKTRAPWL